MPIGLLLLLAAAAAGGAYALSQRGSDEGKKKKPQTLTDQLPGGKSEKAEAVKAKIETLKKKAAQGDKDAGRVLEDLKRTWGNLTK